MILKFFLICAIFTNILLASNKLANETSPYLLQHKDNPVNWYPWSPEAFSKAKKENKKIFLSIGYSTCHWCHVMAHESFENKDVAKLLNENYVSIKLDKEQYPHIDTHYQTIFRLMNNRSGGWPLTMVLTPDKKTFFSATYMPKDDGYGQRGLINTLKLINAASIDAINKSADEIDNVFNSIANTKKIKIKITDKITVKVVNEFKDIYDYKYKGFSKNPKFPNANNITLLLKIYQITKNKDALEMATSTLTAMAKGGIYDQIEGGFYRYTVDEKWMIPHFEKMLYTNGELLESYILAYKITNNPLYKKIITETIAQIDKRFKSDDVYMSASNADSKNFEGHNEEGFYFVYEYNEIEEYLEKNNVNENDIKNALAYYGITKGGNFETDLSNAHILSNESDKKYLKVKELLVKYRSKKEYPFIDNKINTAWNAMYLKSKFLAGIINKKYIKEAIVSLDKLLEIMYTNGTLHHQTIHGVQANQKALLEDYAFLASTLFEAYQSTLDSKYFKIYDALVNQSIDKFYKDGRWRESDDNFVSYAKISHGGYASTLSTNIINLINYSSVKANTKIYDIALKTIDNNSLVLNENPSYYPYATLAVLLKKYEPVFLKSNMINSEKLDLESIKYPFLYKYEENTPQYLACKMNACFSFSKDLNIVKKDIEDLLK